LGSNILDSSWMRRMFDSVPDRYVFLNKILTLGQDERWRNKILKTIKPRAGEKILDVCTGTGDLALKFAKTFPNTKVYAVDFSRNMLSEAEKRADKMHIKSIIFNENNCKNMDFESDYFDYVMISFGFRNISYSQENLTDSLREIHRVLRQEGKFIILETSQPKNTFIKKLFHIYAKRIVPLVGEFLSGNKKPYAYLGGSIVRFFGKNELERKLISEGFQKEKIMSFMSGGILLCVFRKT
jgi:demethylmenaquinone methyltransferase/2-methoxy-6-polyprenyl-1,4-benzoquinol methylase